MKKMIVLLLLALVSTAQAQQKPKQVQTATLSVAGNCGQCKKRIENAADLKGVKNAEWNEKTKILTVTYRADKISEEKIKEAVLKAGHDVGSEKAPDPVYKDLPECCKYRDHSHDGK